MEYDVAVIGGGPGGYVAAIRAAQLGGRVLLVEKDKLGGVCLNRGCIPTKTLLKSAEKYQELKHCAEFGLQADNISFDFTAVMARKASVVNSLRGGIEQLIKSNGIDLVMGRGELTGVNGLMVAEDDGNVRDYTARKVIIAAGSDPGCPPVPGLDLPEVIHSDTLLQLQHVPKSLMVLGAGVVGMEFAAILASFGCQVTLVEMLPTILPMADSDIIKRVGLILRKRGLKIFTGAKVISIGEGQGGVVVKVDTGKGLQEISVEKVLVATGRRPVIKGLGLDAAGIKYSKMGIDVNEQMQTNIAGIYAIGDVTGRHMLAHVASAAAVVAAEHAMGAPAAMDYKAIPSCIFTTPEIAMVGLTEQEAQAKQFDIKVSRFNFAANGKAVSMGETDGLVKIIACAVTGKILGMHILGPHASDLIMEGTMAIKNNLTAQAIADTIHPHPTLSETVWESALGIKGHMLHQVKLKGL